MWLKDWLWRTTYPTRDAVAARWVRRAGATFAFAGRERPLFVHAYNATWRNERAVEIPLALEALDASPVLEVGNVLGHYGRSGHVVVDKYERAPGVVNIDALDFAPAERFARIVSISTLEHIGFDEDVRDAGKPGRAIAHLRSLLAPGGLLFVTIPLGYNAAADALFAPGADAFDDIAYLRRTGELAWAEASWPEVRSASYGAPFPFGNGVAVGVARRP
jgi:SAM-dependent methyltransferase